MFTHQSEMQEISKNIKMSSVCGFKWRVIEKAFTNSQLCCLGYLILKDTGNLSTNPISGTVGTFCNNAINAIKTKIFVKSFEVLITYKEKMQNLLHTQKC